MERISVEDHILVLIKEIWEKHSYLGPWELEFIEDIEDYILNSQDQGIKNISLSRKQVEKILEVHAEFYDNTISMDYIIQFQKQLERLYKKGKKKKKHFNSYRN